MPELPEVEYARRQCHAYCVGRKIAHIEIIEQQSDALVFSGLSPDEFIKPLEGRMVVDTKRWGKYFVLSKFVRSTTDRNDNTRGAVMDKEPHIVGHFGMTGSLKFKHDGEQVDALHGKEEKQSTWPPRFWKAIFTLGTKDSKETEPIIMAFSDARRLGRMRLIWGPDPLQSEPISKLGFDPLLNLPNEEEFTRLVQKRAMPIKALLLDQGFSAGVGNWVADEILYHSRIHPAQYANTLTNNECHTLREKMYYVCHTSAELEGNSTIFPEDWLMTYRWSKGKGKGKGTLPNGHKLAFETVGGRTSAFVPALQTLRRTKGANVKTGSRKRTRSNKTDSDKPANMGNEEKPSTRSSKRKTRRT